MIVKRGKQAIRDETYKKKRRRKKLKLAWQRRIKEGKELGKIQLGLSNAKVGRSSYIGRYILDKVEIRIDIYEKKERGG